MDRNKTFNCAPCDVCRKFLQNFNKISLSVSEEIGPKKSPKIRGIGLRPMKNNAKSQISQHRTKYY